MLLAVDFQERYTDMPTRVRAGLDQGLFGDLILLEARLKWFRGDQYYEGWHGTWKMDGGGSLMNQTVHLIDQIQWYGGDIEQVVGRMKVCTHKIETEDLGIGLIDFKNGAKGVIVGTTTFPESRTYDMEIHGSKFGAAWGSVNKEYSKSLPAGVELPPRPADAPKNIFEDVLGALRHGRKVLVDGREGRKSVELIPGGLQVSHDRKAGEAAAEDLQAAGGVKAGDPQSTAFLLLMFVPKGRYKSAQRSRRRSRRDPGYAATIPTCYSLFSPVSMRRP